MKITSIILALGAVVASVHAGLPVVGDVLEGLKPAAAPAAGYKRQLNLVKPVLDTAGAAANTFPAVGSLAQAAPVSVSTTKRGLLPATGIAPLDSIASKSPVKRGVNANVNVDAQVKAVIKLYVEAVAKIAVEVKADLIAQVTAALVEAKVDITAEVHAAIVAQVNLVVDAKIEAFIGVNAHLEVNADLALKIETLIRANIDAAVNVNVDGIIAALSLQIKAEINAVVAAVVDVDIVAKVLAAVHLDAVVKAVLTVDVSAVLEVCLAIVANVGAVANAVAGVPKVI